MEFFEFLRIPQVIMQFFRGGMSGGGISLDELYILLGVAGGVYLVSLVLGGLALYNMAERAGIKHAWLGFIPFAHTYFAGKVAGEAPFFGRKMKRAGLYAMIAEFVYCAFEVLSLVTSILLSSAAYYETNYIDGNPVLVLNPENVPSALLGLQNASVWFSVLGMVANLLMIVFFCAVYNALYRKYSPKNPFLMTVFSVIFPVRAFFTFAVRENEPVDYGDYMQKRLEQMMRQTGVFTDGANAPQKEDPFTDFASQNRPSAPASPFAEFEDPPAANGENAPQENSPDGNSDE